MIIENDKQLQSMKKIGEIVANCLQLLKVKAQPGMTTKELDEIAGKYLAEFGAVSAPISCYKFPGHTCISVNNESAHGIPGDKVLQDGDLINIDVSAQLDGFFGDNGESFVLGKGTKIKNKLCRVVKDALDVAIANAVAGRNINELGRAVQQVAKKNKLTVIENLGGHGIGKTLHDQPDFIPSFFDPDDSRKFKENCCVAIEPFVSNGGNWVDEADDCWTLYLDKHLSAQKEHSVVITKKKPIILTIPTKTFD